MSGMELDTDRAHAGPPRLYFGKYAGVVIDAAAADGEEHRGEVKVRVPGILEEMPDGNGNRPLEILAAPCFVPGFFVVPEKGDSVWVEFAAGDINFPIWTGVWYPKGKTPRTTKEEGSGEAPTEKQKIIRTRSGKVIQLDDTGDDEKVTIRDEKGTGSITMDKDGITIEHGRSVKIACGDAIAIALTDKDITINGSEKLTLAGKEILLNDKLAVVETILGPLTDFLMKHQHLGNMGGPTPLMPPAMTDAAKLQADAATGIHSSKKPG